MLSEQFKQALEPIYELFGTFEKGLNKKSNGVRLIIAVICLLVNIFVPVVYLIAHKPKIAVWSMMSISLQLTMWALWAFSVGIMLTIVKAILSILVIVSLAFWLYALFLIITKIVPEFLAQRSPERV